MRMETVQEDKSSASQLGIMLLYDASQYSHKTTMPPAGYVYEHMPSTSRVSVLGHRLGMSCF